MKLRSLLHRRPADQVPVLPAVEPEDGLSLRGTFALRTKPAQEERLERLLTPSELDMVRHRQV
ncbi:hypothetical protein [Nocardia sp. NPDC052566]|uniref:hypothetical protein n=1 Tax=Nocardia sp. NPDC052566 TaxID=3364330 RepID=UPI0037C79450